MRTPTRLALSLGYCLTTLASTAFAADSLVHLSWNDCSSMPGAAANIDYACDGTRTGTPFKLVLSFVSPANLTAFVGIQASIDITTEHNADYPQIRDPLPDWWRLADGECRSGAVQFPLSLNGIGSGATGACQNPWLGAVTGGGYRMCTENLCENPTNTTTRTGWTRLKVAFARETETQLVAGQEYVVGAIGIDTWKDQDAGDGAGVCEGCCTPMRILPVILELYQTTGTLPQDIYYLYGTEGVLGRSSGLTVQPVHWQQGGSACNAVPVKRATWGSIKATYR